LLQSLILYDKHDLTQCENMWELGKHYNMTKDLNFQ